MQTRRVKATGDNSPLTIMEGVADPRMPAILEPEDWGTWLGEGSCTPDEAKAVCAPWKA